MKWFKHPKGQEQDCGECGGKLHTLFEREDGMKACGRCFRKAYAEGDTTENVPAKPEPEAEAAQS